MNSLLNLSGQMLTSVVIPVIVQGYEHLFGRLLPRQQK